MPYERSAAVYDAIHRGMGKDYAAEAATVAALVLERCPGARRLLDVACGTGTHLQHLRHRFAVVEGLERSEHMASIARVKLPGVTVHEGDMRGFALGHRFDAVTCMFSSIGYAGTVEGLGRSVAAMAAHLDTGGVVVVDAWLTPDQWHDGHLGAQALDEPGLAIARVDTSHRIGRTSVLDFHYTVATTAGVDRFSERHELTMFTTAEYEAAFSAAGFTVERVPGLPDGRDRYVGILGTRP